MIIIMPPGFTVNASKTLAQFRLPKETLDKTQKALRPDRVLGPGGYWKHGECRASRSGQGRRSPLPGVMVAVQFSPGSAASVLSPK